MKIKLHVTDCKSRDEQFLALLCKNIIDSCVKVFNQFDWDFDFDEDIES